MARVHPWIETLGVLAIALLGCGAGLLFSRLRAPYWLLGYFPPVALIVTVALTRWREELAFSPVLSWFVAGRSRFVVLAVAGTLALTTPLSRIRRKRDRAWISVFMAVVVGYCLTPFLIFALIQEHLRGLETNLNEDGVCLQSNHYTCGPAAAVTALRRLGYPAEEGELAVLARTTPTGGTPADSLAMALRDRYGPEGLSVEYRYFRDLAELRDIVNPGRMGGGESSSGGSPVIAVVKHSFLVDHYVAVLEITAEEVTLGDPLRGKRIFSYEDFDAIWRRSGIVLRRE